MGAERNAKKQEQKKKEDARRMSADRKQPWASHTILDHVSAAMVDKGNIDQEMQDLIDDSTRMEVSLSEADAATKVQAMQRRKLAMQKVESMKQEKKAATSI